jgi:hypothetical protein
MDELDSLLSSPQTPKKARIFPSPPRSPLSASTSIPSTVPFPPLPNLNTYAPYSPLPLLARLRPFALYSFIELESPLDGVSLAKKGWSAVGRYEVGCGVCGGRVNVKGLEEIKDGSVRREVGRRLGQGVRGKHEISCPWRIRDCPGECSFPLEDLRRIVYMIRERGDEG